MNNNQLKKFVGPLASVDIRFAAPSSSTIVLIRDRCQHRNDLVHEEDGGNDDVGPRPQRGIELLEDELASLTFRNGIAFARDDVTGTELVPDLVVTARREEMTYFKTLGAYKVLPRSHQRQHGGKIIGTRWVDLNKGDVETPNCRSS